MLPQLLGIGDQQYGIGDRYTHGHDDPHIGLQVERGSRQPTGATASPITAGTVASTMRRHLKGLEIGRQHEEDHDNGHQQTALQTVQRFGQRLASCRSARRSGHGAKAPAQQWPSARLPWPQPKVLVVQVGRHGQNRDSPQVVILTISSILLDDCHIAQYGPGSVTQQGDLSDIATGFSSYSPALPPVRYSCYSLFHLSRYSFPYNAKKRWKRSSNGIRRPSSPPAGQRGPGPLLY